MEFNTDELDKVIMNEENKPSIDIHSTNSSLSATIIKNEPTMTTNNNGNQEYCLVIFNNPRWSRCLRKKSTPNEQKQTEGITVKNEPQDVSLDDLFVAQLRQLIDNYMLHTNRPFPIKYFLNFTPN